MVAWVTAPRRRCALLLLTLLVCVSLLLGDGIFLAACRAFQQQHRHQAESNIHSLSATAQETVDKISVINSVPEEQLKSSSKGKQDSGPALKSVAPAPPIPKSTKNKINKKAVLPDSKVKPSVVTTRKYPKVKDYKDSFNFVLNHKDICGKDEGSSIPLLIIVTTGVTKFDARDALRTTWGGYARDLGAKMIFLLGRTATQDVQDQVQDEDAVYKDIVQADFTDCYVNMTLKTVTMMKWVSEHCSKARFVLKTDDDMFINVDLLLSYVGHMRNATKTIIGKVAKGWKPHRDQRNKWFVSPEQFSGAEYPPFTTGPAYLFTGDAARPLYEASLQQSFLYLEDVLVTGIVAQKVSVKRIHQPAMRNRPQKVTFCSFRQLMTSHKHSPDDIENLWEEVNRTGVVCKPAKPASDAFATANDTTVEDTLK